MSARSRRAGIDSPVNLLGRRGDAAGNCRGDADDEQNPEDREKRVRQSDLDFLQRHVPVGTGDLLGIQADFRDGIAQGGDHGQQSNLVIVAERMLPLPTRDGSCPAGMNVIGCVGQSASTW